MPHGSEALLRKLNSIALAWRGTRNYSKKRCQKITPHTFRRTFFTELIKADGNLYHIAQMLGHESLEHLNCYARLNIKPLKEAHKMCHPRGEDPPLGVLIELDNYRDYSLKFIGTCKSRKKGKSNKEIKLEKKQRFLNKKNIFSNTFKQNSYNPPDRKQRTLIEVPKIFCIIDNPSEVYAFFTKINKSKNFMIDYRYVEVIRPDALLYLISWIAKQTEKYGQRGKLYAHYRYFPLKQECREIIENSGLKQYIRGIKDKENPNVFKIIEGKKAEGFYIKKVMQFIMKKLELKKSPPHIYNAISECLGNVTEHAYTQKMLKKTWWLMAKFYDEEKKFIRITILDNGNGIIKTIRKSLTENLSMANESVKKIASFVGIQNLLGVSSDALLESALQRDNNSTIQRTRTGVKYRGKGLPSLYQLNELNEIQNLKIVTNEAIYNSENPVDPNRTPTSFNGTLLVWDVYYDKDRCS